MGFATPIETPIPQPRYKGTIVCKGCHGEYRPGGAWLRGWYDPESTTTYSFHAVSKVPVGECPACGHREKNDD